MQEWEFEFSSGWYGSVPDLSILHYFSGDFLGFQSQMKDPIHIILLMKSTIPFFIHFFNDLTLVYEHENLKNDK